jgi:hypothetical protein
MIVFPRSFAWARALVVVRGTGVGGDRESRAQLTRAPIVGQGNGKEMARKWQGDGKEMPGSV